MFLGRLPKHWQRGVRPHEINRATGALQEKADLRCSISSELRPPRSIGSYLCPAHVTLGRTTASWQNCPNSLFQQHKMEDVCPMDRNQQLSSHRARSDGVLRGLAIQVSS